MIKLSLDEPHRSRVALRMNSPARTSKTRCAAPSIKKTMSTSRRSYTAARPTMPSSARSAQSVQPPEDGDQRHRVHGHQRGSGSTGMAGTRKRLDYVVFWTP